MIVKSPTQQRVNFVSSIDNNNNNNTNLYVCQNGSTRRCGNESYKSVDGRITVGCLNADFDHILLFEQYIVRASWQNLTSRKIDIFFLN